MTGYNVCVKLTELLHTQTTWVWVVPNNSVLATLTIGFCLIKHKWCGLHECYKCINYCILALIPEDFWNKFQSILVSSNSLERSPYQFITYAFNKEMPCKERHLTMLGS